MDEIKGQLNSSTAQKTYAEQFDYLPDGRIERLKIGNGLWEAAKFNDRLQVTEMGLGESSTNMNLWKINYDYDETLPNGTTANTGNPARQTISFENLAYPFVQTYKYDALYRITEAKETNNNNQNWIQTFGYDRYGNRTQLSEDIAGKPAFVANAITHPSIDPLTNRFEETEGYDYDKVGNVILDANGRSFTFDGNNKQILVTDGNGTVGEYFYDGDGKRIKKNSYLGGVLDETSL